MRTKGTLEGGGVVDKHSKVTFTVGDGDVIQGWKYFPHHSKQTAKLVLCKEEFLCSLKFTRKWDTGPRHVQRCSEYVYNRMMTSQTGNITLVSASRMHISAGRFSVYGSLSGLGRWMVFLKVSSFKF